MLIVLGFLLILLASVLESYCEFNRLARQNIRHKIFNTPFRYILEAGWIILLLAGGSLLFLIGGLGDLMSVILLVIGIGGFWLVFPFIITPIMRNRLLPPWDNVKEELASKGYNEKNYWRGDWWMAEKKPKRKS